MTNDVLKLREEIDQLKEALYQCEERYRLLFKHAPTGIYELVMDSELGLPVFSNVNDVLLDYTGYSEEEFLNMNLSDLLTEESLNHFIDRMEKVQHGEKIPDTAEFEVITKNGRHIWVLINAKWFYEDNVRTKATVIAHNITEAKEMAKKRLDFMAITSHELRTPLAIVKGYLDLLFSKKGLMTEKEIQSSFKRAQKNVGRLEQLITGVSELTRIERGIFTLNRKTTDLRNFMSEIIVPYGDILGANFKFTYNTDSKDLLLLEIDRDRMTQVLSNLLQNAINHTSSKDRKIKIECLTNLPENIKIKIMDNGAGIPEGKQEEIFEPFVSIPSEHSVQGTGLGLYISRIIIEGHEGKIWAKNGGIDGKGTTFTIEIPKKSL